MRHTLQRLVRTTALLGLLLAGLAGCSQVTLANYEKLRAGMNYEEVRALLGAPASCNDLLVIKHCNWGNDESGVTASFVGDKLVSHTAKNLH